MTPPMGMSRFTLLDTSTQPTLALMVGMTTASSRNLSITRITSTWSIMDSSLPRRTASYQAGLLSLDSRAQFYHTAAVYLEGGLWDT